MLNFLSFCLVSADCSVTDGHGIAERELKPGGCWCSFHMPEGRMDEVSGCMCEEWGITEDAVSDFYNVYKYSV